jgi:nitrite reductase/ring-hydroxylating ferredoxin subunit
MPERVKVAQKKEIPEGEGICVDVGNERVAVFNHKGEFYAMSDLCPHAGGPLSDGWVEEGKVTCPWHGWVFKLECAESDGVERFPCTVEGEDVYVEVPE